MLGKTSPICQENEGEASFVRSSFRLLQFEADGKLKGRQFAVWSVV